MGSRSKLLGAMSAVVMTLSSCGGDDASTGATPVSVAPSPPPPTPVPAPTPSPSPPPTLTGQALLNSTIGLNQQAEFATVSWLYRSSAAGEADGEAAVGVGFDTARRESTMTLPGLGVKHLEAFPSETDETFGGAFLAPAGGTVFYFLRPGPQNRVLALASTSVGYFGWSTFNGSPRGDHAGVLGYGVPTPLIDLLEFAGGAYNLYGFAVVRPGGATTDPRYFQLFGNIEIGYIQPTVSGGFATGTVAGYFPQFTQLAERFTFTSFRYSGQDFGGTVSVDGGAAGVGEYQGRYTGPFASEILIRWRAPYRDPATGRIGMIHGVLAGRRP